MNYLYNKPYFPPIPVIPIRLSVDGKSPMTDYLTALIDTGADFTIIPVTYLIILEALRLIKQGHEVPLAIR